MSYLKLCQVSYQGNPDSNGHPQIVYYEEDCNGNVLVNNPTYPLTISCEVIDWGSSDNFSTRGAITSFAAVPITLSAAPGSGTIRQAIFNQLVGTYPTLVI